MSLFFSSAPVYHFSFYLVRLLLASGSLFSPTICLSRRPSDRRNGKSEPSIPFDLVIVIFFQILPLFVEAPSSVRPAGTKKETRSSVYPSARGFPYDCIREIAIYGCRYCAAGYPLDTEGSERSSHENCPLRHDPANREFPVSLPSSLAFESLR